MLSILSLDIETDIESGEILAIGLVSNDPWIPLEENTETDDSKHDHGPGPGPGSKLKEEVLFVGVLPAARRPAKLYPGQGPQRRTDPTTGGPTETPSLDASKIRCFPDERSLLEAFRNRVFDWDPDIVTGWNVIDFDFQVISQRFDHHGIPFILGRADVQDVFLSRERRLASRTIIHGRQVLDGVRLVRAGPQQFSDYSLETVASSLLGYGKRLEQAGGKVKTDALANLYHDDPLEFCRYCGQDARLVLEILENTGLIDLTVQRSRLIGIGLERAWTSIASFDFMYIEGLHRRGIVAPTLGVDALPLEGAPGGAIIEPQAGLYDNVLVYDFKSLYPSIIRTFNIDPLSYIHPDIRFQMDENELSLLIKAPNGAVFRRDSAILPELLDRFAGNRDDAKERNDEVASYVYKIIMNSFYGVLGASGSRFAGSELAGAITSFGHMILRRCEEDLKSKDFRVLYGDTDSLFVLSGRPQGTSPDELYALGRKVCQEINAQLNRYIEEDLRLRSKLELELEKIYSRFFLPHVRGSSAAGRKPREGDTEEVSSGRGRAKGYAGMVLAEVEKSTNPPMRVDDSELEIVGMEAIRRDWTALAKGFQVNLLKMVFQDVPLESIQQYVKEIVERLFAGELDRDLVYVKALRKPTGEYKRTLPPHVKAASQLDAADQKGLIRYYWTKDGPQPESRCSSPIDYDHYVEKQLKPIATMFTDALKTDIEHLIDMDNQLWLF
jgi:DNA polymerase-2